MVTRMKHTKLPGFNVIRERFRTVDEVAEVINRSRRYTQDRITMKKDFTARDRKLIAKHLGMSEEEIFIA